MSEPWLRIPVRQLDGQETTLEEFRGKVLLIVNTASECGFTPQFTGLQKLHRKFVGEGLVVIGFPCNQFGGQEPGNAKQIMAFCKREYGIEFPMYEKIEVNGSKAHPLYRYLKDAAPGMLGNDIKWNFTKFLVDRTGRSIRRFAPATPPEHLEEEIRRLLAIPSS